MGVGVVMPVRIPVVVGMTMGVARRITMSMVVMMGVGRGGNHAKDVIL
jgi:hypothetical protein